MRGCNLASPSSSLQDHGVLAEPDWAPASHGGAAPADPVLPVLGPLPCGSSCRLEQPRDPLAGKKPPCTAVQAQLDSCGR